jgi:2-hydroxy-3-keto-5-methylthiopentenyl-1-phosphate phosphatase
VRVVLDWDGTVTETDALDLVLREFGDQPTYDQAEARLGELTLNEVIAHEFAGVRAPLEQVVAWVRENVRVRDGFARFARDRRPLIVSSGFHELIEPVLEREGVRLDVLANRIEPRSEGWRARFRSDDACSACGEPCKRSDVAVLDEFVYVGDGVSDRCVALSAARVFARDGLARYLTARNVPFEPFTDFVELDATLAARER